MHAFLYGLERVERVYHWLQEIYQGFTGTPGVARLKTLDLINYMAVQACIDCRGLYDSAVSPVVGSLTDMCRQLYLMALRESLRLGPLSELCWIETIDMLADAQTKWMDDFLWFAFYKNSKWAPKNAACTRRTDRGQLEKSSKTVLALRAHFVHGEGHESYSLEHDALSSCHHVFSSCVSWHDILYLLTR